MHRLHAARRLAGTAAAALAGIAGLGVVAAAVSAPAAHPGTAAATPAGEIGPPPAVGDAPRLGSMVGHHLNHPIVAMAADPAGTGYWLVASDGGIFNYGTAHYYGAAGNVHLNSPIVAMAAAPDGHGYWLVARDGGVFDYGSAHFYGSAGSLHLKAPVIGIAAAPDGHGYWLVGSDGGVFSYGSAHFRGSTGARHLNSAIVGIAPASSGEGYWLVAGDGGIFTFGSAHFYGSAGNIHLNSPIVAMAAAPGGHGYWLAASDGGVFTYGFAHFRGALGSAAVAAAKARVMGIAPAAGGLGYWLLPLALPPPPPPPPPALSGPTVSLGDCSAGVLTLQQRLSALGYWLGTPDGCFGDSTQQAVWAIQKAAGLSRDGVAGPAVWNAIGHHVVPTPRTGQGYVIEVNLANDLVMVVNNGKVEWTLNTSTGGGYTYYENGVANVATTPQGVFNTYYAVNGMVTDSLGQLWRPRYFTGGFAIHGDGYVPPEPVSHGCVRLSNEAIDWVWANNIDPIGTEVYVYS